MTADMFQDWVPFFEYLASTAGAILGLAFVAIHLNHSNWVRHSVFPAEARTALTELAGPLFFSLIVLMPGHNWLLGAISVSALGLFMIIWHALIFCQRRKSVRSNYPDEYGFHRLQAWLLLVLAAEYIALPLVPYEWKAYSVLWMVFSGLTETWWMLFRSRPTGRYRASDVSTLPTQTAPMSGDGSKG